MLPDNMEPDQSGGDADGRAKRARSLGAILRSEREARELSIREVSERIRIPARYLTMLEANDYGAIADELYLLPFVRGYADFLGLEAGTLSARFLRGIQPPEKAVDPEPEPVEEDDLGRGRWFTTAAVMLFVALALYLVGLK
ncbi:MAG TPA: helix-turn-helix domain-containing protein [Candidatus Binataceae bacterium]|jgi:cytoskeletal protein RodZ